MSNHLGRLLTVIKPLFFILLSLTATKSIAIKHDINTNLITANLNEAVKRLSETSVLDGMLMIQWQDKLSYTGSTDNDRFNQHTRFEWASITKSLTAIAVLKLIEQQKLSLNTKVHELLPNFKYQKVTLKQLLNHSAGLPKGVPPYFYQNFSNQQIIEHTHEIPLVSEPGSKTNYSNLGYIYLRLVIESVTNQTLPKALAALGLPSNFTERESNQALIEGFTLGAGNSADNKAIMVTKPAKKAHSTTIWGASGAYGSIDELMSFVAQLNSHKLLSKQTWQMVFDTENIQGLGFSVSQKSGHLRISHTGRIDGFQSAYEYYPKLGLRIAVLLNNDTSERNRLLSIVRSILFDKPYDLPQKYKAIDVQNFNLDKYVGTYQTDTFTFKIVKLNNKLYLSSHNDPLVELVFYGANKAFSKRFDLQIIFKQQDGKISSANYRYYSQDNLGDRQQTN